jgi:hypothetical protein
VGCEQVKEQADVFITFVFKNEALFEAIVVPVQA